VVSAKWLKILAAWMLRLLLCVAGTAHVRAALADPIWASITPENSDLPGVHQTASAIDADGTLWVGTADGLARVDRNGHWQTYTKTNTNGGFPDDDVHAVSAGSDGVLWVGTAHGLARRDRDGRWQTYTKASTNGGLPDDDISELAQGRDGVLWIAARGPYGLIRLDGQGRWRTYNIYNTGRRTLDNPDTNRGIPQNWVSSMSPDSNGILWVGTGRGLARFDGDHDWQTYTKANTNGGLPDDDIQKLAVGPDGVV
jgi:ligand-binding sensor domain-containing protein